IANVNNPYANNSDMTMKKLLLNSPVILAAGMLLSLLAHHHTLAQTQILDRVVAIVDEDLVLESELKERTASITERLRSQYGQLPPMDVLQKQILEQLIVERVQLQLAARYEIVVSDQEIDQAIGRILQNNGITLAVLEEDLQRQGMSMADLRKQISQDLTINHLQQGVVNGRISVTEQEIDNFLASTDGKFATSPDFRLGHILISVPSTADQEMISAAEKEAT